MLIICKACYFHIHELRHVRVTMSKDTAQMIACSIIGSRLDYCNALLAGMSEQNLNKLQRVQNSLACCNWYPSLRPHHTSTLRPSLVTGSCTNHIQNLHASLQGSSYTTTNLPGGLDLWLHPGTEFTVYITETPSRTTYQNRHVSKIFQIHRGKDMEQSSGKPQNFEQASFIQERSKNIFI